MDCILVAVIYVFPMDCAPCTYLYTQLNVRSETTIVHTFKKC